MYVCNRLGNHTGMTKHTTQVTVSRFFKNPFTFVGISHTTPHIPKVKHNNAGARILSMGYLYSFPTHCTMCVDYTRICLGISLKSKQTSLSIVITTILDQTLPPPPKSRMNKPLEDQNVSNFFWGGEGRGGSKFSIVQESMAGCSCVNFRQRACLRQKILQIQSLTNKRTGQEKWVKVTQVQNKSFLLQ